MTVKRYAGDKMVGLSTDTKPTNVPDGATFYESDTPALYIKVGGSWVQINTGGGGGGVSATGTPLNDQLAVWTSASSIEGDPNLTWNGTQMTVTGDVEANEFIGDLRGAVRFKAQAGEALAKGDAVYISGVSGQTPIVSKADADDAAKMPAFGLVTAATGLGNPCEVVTFGTFKEYDTSTPGWSLGDTLYISTTPGQLTNSPPTGESGLIQNIGKVQRVDSLDGRIKVGGAGRTNATPNLNTGRIFAGNASNQAVATDTLYVDIANSRIGINETSPTAALHIGGTGTIKYGIGPLTELVSHSNASYINLDGQSLAAFRRSGGDSQYFHVNGHIGLGFPTVADVRIYKDAADQLALRRNLNPQTFSIYNTYTDASNYERATFAWDSNTFVISPQGLGTGSTARALRINFGTGGTNGGNNYITGGVNQIQIAAGGAPYLVVGVSEWKVGQWNGLPLTIGTKSQPGVTDRNAQPIVLDVAGGSGAGTAGYFAIKTAPSLTTGTTGHTSVERLRISGDGNVGIGTTNPTSKFVVSGTSGQLFSVSDSMTGTIFSVNDISGIPSIEVNSNGNISLAEFSGNVGIGTSSPTSPLHVIGNATISSTANIGQISLNGTRTITSNTGNATMRLRALGRTTAGAAHIIGDTANNVMTNSSGDTVNLSIDNTVNQTGTAGHTDVLINRTETAVGSGNQYLLDAQVGGTSYFKIGTDGKFGRMNNSYSAWTSSQNTIEMGGNGLRIYAYGQEIAGCYGPTTKFHVGKYTGGNYTFLKSEITGTLALEHGTTATGLHLYNTYTDASNYERGTVKWDTNELILGTEALGTGTKRDVKVNTNTFVDGDLTFASDGAGANWLKFYRQQGNYWRLTSSGVGDVFTVIGNLITFPQNVLIQRGGLEVQNTIHNTAEPFKGTITFNDAATTFTAFKVNVTDTNSASSSLLMDLQVGAASKFKVDKSGFITATRFSTANGYMWFNNNGAYLRISDSYLYSPNTGGNVWEVRNGTNAQEFRIFNTYTNDTNYERAALKWDGNNFTFSTEAAGTGNVRNFNFAGGNVGINTPGTVSYPLQITGRTTDAITARILNQSPTGGYGLWVESNDQNSGIFHVAFNSIGGPSANLLTNLGSNAYFQVYEGTSTKTLQLGQTFSGGVNFSVKSNLQIGIDSDNDGVGAFEIAKANNYNGRLDSDGTSLFRILNSGNVGIGITNPTYKLVIAQDTNTTANLLQLRNSDALYSQTWDFQSDTAKDLVVTGGSGNGGVVFKPGTRGFSVHNGTNPQKLLVYNTYTNDTNYERGSIEWSSNLLLIEAQYSGTGASRYLRIKTGTNYFELIPSSGQINFSGGTRFKYPSNGTLEVRTSANVPGDLVAGTYSVYTKSGVGSAVATQAGDSTTLTTTTPTQIASFPTTHLGAKLVIQAADTVTGERQMSEILLVHDGTTVTSTEYGIIYTNASLATYTASISGGNVIVQATSASTNSTTYKVMETLI